MTPEQKLERAKQLRIEADEAWESGSKEHSTYLHGEAARLKKEAEAELKPVPTVAIRRYEDGLVVSVPDSKWGGTAPLLEWFWSPEARKRMGLDEPGIHVTSEPYDRVAVLGVEMSIDELRGIVQCMIDEYRAKAAAR